MLTETHRNSDDTIKSEYPYNLITEYLIDELNINKDTVYSIETVPAVSLISPMRFDLMAKWMYIDCYVSHSDMRQATEVYRDSINAFSCGSYKEPGKDNKNSFDRYLENLNELISDIGENGFDSHVSLIPVGSDGMIMDGAHRVAVAAYFGLDVSIIRFNDKKSFFVYDHTHFRRYLMKDINMGYMALTYAGIKDNCYMACIWPVAGRQKYEEIEAILKQAGPIVYSQDIYLTYRGICNFMVEIYGHQAWVGSSDDNYAGVDAKARACYDRHNSMRVYMFEAPCIDTVIDTKAKIRDLFTLQNHSIHISDDQRETIQMAGLLFGPDAVDKLNSGIKKTVADDNSIPKEYRKETLEYIHEYQLNRKLYSRGVSSYREFCSLKKALRREKLSESINKAKRAVKRLIAH